MSRHMMLDVADAVAQGQGRRPYHVPLALPPLVAGASSLGVSGSRAPDAGSLRALADLAALAPEAPVIVGDQRGIDAAAVGHWPHAQVVARAGDEPRALVARSVAMVARLARCAAPLLAAFPARACPKPILPGPRWQSSGSGTWSTAALALGQGAALLLWLPAPALPPTTWGLRYLGGGWWYGAREGD